jgi:hypothetical protein
MPHDNHDVLPEAANIAGNAILEQTAPVQGEVMPNKVGKSVTERKLRVT